MSDGSHDIKRALEILFEPGAVFEFRALRTKAGTRSGYFQRNEGAVKAAVMLDTGRATGVYVTLNPVIPEIHARSRNRISDYAPKDSLTKDEEIARRLSLLIDFDPKRPVGISATFAEKEAARELMESVVVELRERFGMVPVLIGDSGNGYHLIYAIDLPNDDASSTLVMRVLAALAHHFDTDGVKIDTAVFNAARIVKLYGTVARKGDDTKERPHRRSCVISANGRLTTTPETLEALIAAYDPPNAQVRYEAPGHDGFDLAAFIGVHMPAAIQTDPPIGCRRAWKLSQCPLEPEHDESYAPGIFERGDGSIGFHCFGARCADRHWSDVRAYFEPGYKRAKVEPQLSQQTTPRARVDFKEQPAEMEAAWPELSAPEIQKPSVPMLPCDLLPAPLAPWIIDEAERMNVPLEAIAIPAMIALGSVLGCGVAIQPSWGNENYLALASNWGTVVLPPGSTKTPAMYAALAPLYELQHKAREQYRNESAAMEARRKNLESDLEQKRAELRTALRRRNSPDVPSLTATIQGKEAELAALSVDERVYLLNDATIEALGVVCAQNPRGILLGSDEIVRPFKSWEKPGHEDSRAFMLSGWQGMMPYDGRRISRHVPYIERFSIAMYGGAQPGVMRDYIEAAQGAKAGNDGLVQRLQLGVWPDTLPDYDEKAEENVKRDPDYDARKKAFAIFERLAHFDPLKYGARKVNEIPVFRFAPDAQELFGDFRRELEHRVRKDDELLGNEPLANHFTKYRATMPGLALAAHFAFEAAAEPEDYGNRVSLRAAQIGKAWCTFLEAHARKLYAGGSGEAAYSPSETLCDAIEERRIVDGMALRTIYRWHWPALDTADRLKAALAPLVAANWARIEASQTGGRPSEILRLHPRLRPE